MRPQMSQRLLLSTPVLAAVSVSAASGSTLVATVVHVLIGLAWSAAAAFLLRGLVVLDK